MSYTNFRQINSLTFLLTVQIDAKSCLPKADTSLARVRTKAGEKAEPAVKTQEGVEEEDDDAMAVDEIKDHPYPDQGAQIFWRIKCGGLMAFFDYAVVFTWDAFLELGNLVVPKLKEGKVVPEGRHGFQGKWPEYKRPVEGDSRCCCPALNALANHGILPRDGRNISFKELNDVVRTTYNFAPSFCYFVPKYAATMLNKDYNKDRFDLEEINMHNGIEHDASLTRLDHVFDKDQGKPHMPYVEELLDSASGKDKAGNVLLTGKDLAQVCAKRRADSTVSNPSFSLALVHRMFSSSNNCTLLTIFGGRYDDIKVLLTEERIPDNWESRVRKVNGLTIAAFNTVVLPVEIRTASKTKALVKEYKANAERNRT